MRGPVSPVQNTSPFKGRVRSCPDDGEQLTISWMPPAQYRGHLDGFHSIPWRFSQCLCFLSRLAVESRLPQQGGADLAGFFLRELALSATGESGVRSSSPFPPRAGCLVRKDLELRSAARYARRRCKDSIVHFRSRQTVPRTWDAQIQAWIEFSSSRVEVSAPYLRRRLCRGRRTIS